MCLTRPSDPTMTITGSVSRPSESASDMFDSMMSGAAAVGAGGELDSDGESVRSSHSSAAAKGQCQVSPTTHTYMSRKIRKFRTDEFDA